LIRQQDTFVCENLSTGVIHKIEKGRIGLERNEASIFVCIIDVLAVVGE
jgi:hypothetical protein